MCACGRVGVLIWRRCKKGAEIVSAVSIKGVSGSNRVTVFDLQKQFFVTATKGLDPATTWTPSQIWRCIPRPSSSCPLHPTCLKEIQQNCQLQLSADAAIAAAEVVQAVFSLVVSEYIPIPIR